MAEHAGVHQLLVRASNHMPRHSLLSKLRLAPPQLELPRWSLRCLFVVGGHNSTTATTESAAGRDFEYRRDAVCPVLALNAPDAYLDLGHKVKAMITWVASHMLSFDFLLKTDVDTLICFSMVTDMLDAVRHRFGGDESIYLGHIETCSKIQHNVGERFYDQAYLQDILQREDAYATTPHANGGIAELLALLHLALRNTVCADLSSLRKHTCARSHRPCYPPYMQGLGYVLSRDLVQLLGSMAPSLKVYTNEDMMVGTWLIGHRVNRGRLVARQFTETLYQTTLAECFPLCAPTTHASTRSEGSRAD